MKKALLGLANNIELNLHKIKYWSASFKTHSQGNEIYLLCANATEAEIKSCSDMGITTIPVTVLNEELHHINHKRLLHTYEFLKTSDVDAFIITDVYDVIFQNDPFARLDFHNFDVFLGAEGLDLHQEPWNFDTVKRNFPEFLDSSAYSPIVCSGVIAGSRSALIPMYERMYELCENSTKDHNIMDQAALIVMVALNEIPKLKILKLNENWTSHCAVAGPTPLFEGWGFKNRIIEQGFDVPYMEGNQIKASNLPYDIVHQFNRIPEWNNILTGIYSN